MSSQNSELERTSRYDQDVSETCLDYNDREADFRGNIINDCAEEERDLSRLTVHVLEPACTRILM
ncbi:hypothetical protein ACTXT7_016178 [Hymenolepis weldensis]